MKPAKSFLPLYGNTLRQRKIRFGPKVADPWN